MVKMDYRTACRMALAGEQDGFRFLYESTAQPVYELLLRELKDQPQADQMIGRVYDEAWAKLGNLENPDEFPGWVYGIAEGMLRREKGGVPVPPSGMGEGAVSGGASGSPTLVSSGAASPNAAHSASPASVEGVSPNAAHMNASGAGRGLQQMSAASAGGKSVAGAAGAKTATAAAGAGVKTAFLSTVAGKVVLGVGIAVTAAALGVGGFVLAKKINEKKEEPTTAVTEQSSAVIEIEETVTEAVTEAETEATTEEVTTETAKVDAHALYEAYLRDTLVPERGIHAAEQDQTGWGRQNDGEGPSGSPWFNGTGIYTVDFDDYDGDGEEEMLVISGKTGAAVNNYTTVSYIIQAELYNEADGKVVLDSARDITTGYDGYEGGGFPRILTKIRHNDCFYLVCFSREDSYKTDASSDNNYTIYQTKGGIKPLCSLSFKVALGYGYYLTVSDGRKDPDNPVNSEIRHDASEDPSLQSKAEDSQFGVLFQEAASEYFAEWNIQLDEKGYVSNGTVLVDMELDMAAQKYTMTDAYGFHTKDWGSSGDQGTEKKEGTNEAGNAALPFTGSLEFAFASGAGAWGTGLTLESNGHFTGSFHDSDYDSVSVAEFEGQFTNITKVDEFTYRMELDHYDLEDPIGKEWDTDEGFHMVGADAYGIETGKVFYLYLPGKPISELSEAFLNWSNGSVGDVNDGGKLKVYGLYNEEPQYGFFTYPK